MWQTPVSIPLTCKQADKKYYVLAKGTEFLFSHLPPSSIIVDAVNSRSCQYQFKSTPYGQDGKCLDLFGRETYSSATLQCLVANYQVLLAKYDYQNYVKLGSFIDQLLDSHKDQFMAIINKGQLVAKKSLQSALDAARMAACSSSTAMIMRRASWLQLSASLKRSKPRWRTFPLRD